MHIVLTIKIKQRHWINPCTMSIFISKNLSIYLSLVWIHSIFVNKSVFLKLKIFRFFGEIISRCESHHHSMMVTSSHCWIDYFLHQFCNSWNSQIDNSNPNSWDLKNEKIYKWRRQEYIYIWNIKEINFSNNNEKLVVINKSFKTN